jgi:hypothetical protein
MSAYLTKQAVHSLNSCLAHIREDERRFRDNALLSAAMFVEEPAQRFNYSIEQHAAAIAARFLRLAPNQVRTVQNTVLATNRDTTHDGPYFVYFAPSTVHEACGDSRELGRQVSALNRVLPQLVEAVRTIPPTIASRILPTDPESWWEVLFHLAIHFPKPFLEANRIRWLKVTGLAAEVDPQRTIPSPLPHDCRIPKRSIQIENFERNLKT